ncbi:bifunctional diguanylate cyclase/phosphodiesterase (plasmid) [Bradyrhizobium sp. PMVTL-01]|uniref:bifunctional diguanylate cyclase/phosphodiesterase n=1 Tax=Bradyrhizobium sp. PMVTL-01 TaxID=3434999 RepID=UPI003F6F13F2
MSKDNTEVWPESPLAHFNAKRRRGFLSKAGPIFWVCVCGLTVLAFIGGATALTVEHLRGQELQRSRETLQNAVRLLARHFDQRFADFEAVERSLATELGRRITSPDELQKIASDESFHQMLRARVNDSGDFAGVNLYDVDGNRVASSTKWPATPVNLSDRNYYRTFKRDHGGSPVAVELVQSKLSPGLTIVVARKITGQDGQFLGFITRSISPDDVERFLSSIALPNATVALFHQGGTLLARFPSVSTALGRDFSSSPLAAQALLNGGQATMTVTGFLDREERIASVRFLDQYPLAVSATSKTSIVLANWHSQARLVLAGAGAAGAVGLVMMASIVFCLRKQRRQLDVAVNNMKQGLVLFDQSERLIVCNSRYLDMFGLSPEVVRPGCALRDIIQHRSDIGSLPGGVDAYCEFIRRAKLGRATETLTQTGDGRWMQIINRPVPGGGWVSTIEDVTEQRRAEERIARLARYDVVTGLPNRAFFLERLQQELEKRVEGSLAVCFLDIDEFKSVNDSLGHHIGDELLKSIAAALRDCIGSEAFLARLGGDEFAIFLRESTDGRNRAAGLIADLYRALQRQHSCGPYMLSAEASIGVAIAPKDGGTCEEILQNADLAMYEAKFAGKKSYRFFEPAMEKRTRERRMLEADLRKALVTGEIEVYFQPIVALSSGEIVGCEALARWNHPERGFVSPNEFIPVAEQSGLIDSLGDHVLRLACAEAASWPAHLKVAVNISPAQFKTFGLPLKVASALEKAGLLPSRLELEITEAILIKDDQVAVDILHQLRAIGVRVALDDFGTGYSSLSYLSKFPFDKIKIDRCFIKELSDSSRSISIVKTIVALAAEHKMSTTAEGVETERQRDLLSELSCDEMQGFFVSRPRPAAEVREMLTSSRMFAWTASR